MPRFGVQQRYHETMNDRGEKSVSAVAGGDRRLASLLRASQAFEALDARLRPHLSEASRGNIRVACVEGDCLVLAAASSAWASRARLEAQNLLEHAKELWPGELTKTRIIVANFERV